MGYCARTEDSDFFIRADNLPAASEALKSLNTNPAFDALKTSGSPEGRTFAWMPEKYHEQAEDAEGVFQLLGFETERNDEGLAVVYFDGKVGDDRLFFNAVAHLVEPGSTIKWRGEDGTHWLYDFDGKVMIEREGRIVYT